MSRPTQKPCESCGTTFQVKPKGKIPNLCPDCRASGKQHGSFEPVDEPLTLSDVPETYTLEADASAELTESFEPETFLEGDLGAGHDDVPVPKPEKHEKATWDGTNLDEVRKILDDGIEVDWHRANGRPYAEVHGADRDWFMDVEPGDTVWHDGIVQTR